MEEKTIYILELLMQYEYLSAPKMKELLCKDYQIQINVKTIHTTIDKINRFFDWLGCHEEFIVNHRKKGYTIENPLFSDAQLRFLFDSLETSSVISKKQANQMIKKLQKFSTNAQLMTISSDRITAPTDEFYQDDLFIKLNIIMKAIKEKKSVLFKYVDYYVKEYQGKYEIVELNSKRGNYSKDKSNETYIISPYELLMVWGKYYLISYSSKHKETLTNYRLDRMRMLRTSKEEYIDVLDMYDLENMKKQLVNMYIGVDESTIRLKFKKEIFRSIVDQFGLDNHIEKDINGDPIITIHDFRISDGLIGWLLMLGDKIEVLEPYSLREKITEKLEGTLKKYRL